MDIGEGNNRHDPLPKAGPEPMRILYDRMNKEAANGFSADQVIGATLNVLVNAIRQSYPSRSAAETRFNELVGRTKEMLLSHYDSNTGRRKSIFPFTQYIRPPLVLSDDQIKRPGE